LMIPNFRNIGRRDSNGSPMTHRRNRERRVAFP
jgi:hypothetical protein